MKRKYLFELIEGGENLHVEFKQKFSDEEKIAKEMIAFANTDGGFLIFGVKDSGKVVGVYSEKEMAELVETVAKDYCEPRIDYEIDYFEYEENEIVVCRIPRSDKRPHRIQDYQDKLDIRTAQVYVRVNDKSVPASKEMIRLLRAKTEGKKLQKYNIGKIEKVVFDFLDKKETISVKELCKAANISERRASRTLVKLVRAEALLIHTKENGEEFFTHAG